MVSKEATMTDASTPKSRRPMSPRRRRYWSAIGLAALTGFVGGSWLLRDRSEGGGTLDLLSNGPISPGFAAGAAILWVAGIAICTILYHRAIDDHEEQAWLRAGLAGWYAFAFPAPAWWLLHRAGMVPPVDAMLLFAGSLAVNAIVYLWFKFR